MAGFPAAHAAVLLNGSFNAGPTGEGVVTSWNTGSQGADTVPVGGLASTSAPGGTYALGMPASPDGGFFVSNFFHSSQSLNESISQSVTSFLVGETYRVSFYSANGGWSQGTSAFVNEIATGHWNVSVASTNYSTADYVFGGFGNQTWSSDSFTFVASSDTHLLTFSPAWTSGAGTDGRLALDGVSVTLVPEPSTAFLAVLSVVFSRRSRSR